MTKDVKYSKQFKAFQELVQKYSFEHFPTELSTKESKERLQWLKEELKRAESNIFFNYCHILNTNIL